MRRAKKEKCENPREDIAVNSNNCVAIMAILNAMVRCFKDNIGNVDLTPIDRSLTAGIADTSVIEGGETTNA